MGNEDKKILFIVVLFILGGVIWYYTDVGFQLKFQDFLGSTLPFFYDDYLIEADFAVPNYEEWSISETGSVIISNNRMTLSAPGVDSAAQYMGNLKNKDIKTKIILNPVIIGEVLFGDQPILVSETPCDSSPEFLIEIIKDVTNEDKFVVIINGEPVKEIIILGDQAYITFNPHSIEKVCAGKSQEGGSMLVEYLKSRPYFSCEVQNNEVVISDSFGEGSTFDIHDLTYEPTKFCPLDYPAVVRDYRERGVKSDVRGTITEQLTRGVSFTVPAFQSYEIRYATYWKEGMGPRCTLDKVFDTKTRTCISKIFEQDYIIRDCHTEGCPDYQGKTGLCMDNGVCVYFEEIYIEQRCQELGCPTGYECLPEGYCLKEETQTIYLPQYCQDIGCPTGYTCIEEGLCVKTVEIVKDCKTEGCPTGYTCLDSGLCAKSIEIIPTCTDITCDETYGEYCEMRGNFPVCVRPYKFVEIIRERELIPIGKNQKSFENSLVIGDETITSSRPEFICSDQGEDWNSPQPSKDCWKVSVSFVGDSYTMYDGDEVDLNDYFKLKLYISAHYEYDDKAVDSWTNNFILTIKNFDFIKTEAIRGDEFDYYVIKDSSRNMCFNMNNDLDISFSLQQAGYSLMKTTDLITMQERTMVEKALPKGTTNYCISIDSERYGELFYQVIPYFKLGDEIFFDDEKLTYNYKVVDEIPVNETIIYKEIEKEKIINITKYITIEKPKFEFKWWYIAIPIAILSLVVLLTKKR